MCAHMPPIDANGRMSRRWEVVATGEGESARIRFAIHLFCTRMKLKPFKKRHSNNPANEQNEWRWVKEVPACRDRTINDGKSLLNMDLCRYTVVVVAVVVVECHVTINVWCNGNRRINAIGKQFRICFAALSDMRLLVPGCAAFCAMHLRTWERKVERNGFGICQNYVKLCEGTSCEFGKANRIAAGLRYRNWVIKTSLMNSTGEKSWLDNGRLVMGFKFNISAGCKLLRIEMC